MYRGRVPNPPIGRPGSVRRSLCPKVLSTGKKALRLKPALRPRYTRKKALSRALSPGAHRRKNMALQLVCSRYRSDVPVRGFLIYLLYFCTFRFDPSTNPTLPRTHARNSFFCFWDAISTSFTFLFDPSTNPTLPPRPVHMFFARKARRGSGGDINTI